jgi:diphthamide synthase (EF-2-diphthine--ammonia ligase)
LPTQALAEEMLNAGLTAFVSCVDLKKLPAGLAGRRWSRELLAGLPPECDPCGENGELHTVVTGGPMFDRSIPTRVGEIIERNGFVYADILPIEKELP